jgi:hypothetical protein
MQLPGQPAQRCGFQFDNGTALPEKFCISHGEGGGSGVR